MAVTGDEAPQSRPSKRAKTPVEEPEGLSKYLRGDAVVTKKASVPVVLGGFCCAVHH